VFKHLLFGYLKIVYKIYKHEISTKLDLFKKENLLYHVNKRSPSLLLQIGYYTIFNSRNEAHYGFFTINFIYKNRIYMKA